MYYRGAQAAIVVYDITNSVSGMLAPVVEPLNQLIYSMCVGHVYEGEELGEGTPAAGKPGHRYSPSWQQSGPSGQKNRGFCGESAVVHN